MAQVNPLTREVLIKLVYYGPGLGGKTSSLQYINNVAPRETRGQLVSLQTPVDRTLYFDFLPLRGPVIRDNHVRLQLFTVPGQVYFNATRKLVLTGADGMVFVADSQPSRKDANLQSLENLTDNVREQGRDLAQIPLVFQYNKRDLVGICSKEELDAELNPGGRPSFSTVATSGEGVMEALDSLLTLVLQDLETRGVFRGPESHGTPAFGIDPANLERGLEMLAEAAREADSEGVDQDGVETSERSDVARRPVFTPLDERWDDGEITAIRDGDFPSVVASLGIAVGSLPPPSPAAVAEMLAGESPPARIEHTEGNTARYDRRTLPHEAIRRAASEHPRLNGQLRAVEEVVNLQTMLPRPSTVLHETSRGLFTSLFEDEGDAREAMGVEQDITRGDLQAAILGAERLIGSLLRRGAVLLGVESPDQDVLVAGWLGVSKSKWMAFRAAVRRARSGAPLADRDALIALVTAIDLQLAILGD